MREGITVSEVTLFKTSKGYLHDTITEGWWLDDGERNYSFTEDVFQAFQFPDYDPDGIPKYIEVTHDEEIENREQLCKVLGGEFVKVKITTAVKVEEI